MRHLAALAITGVLLFPARNHESPQAAESAPLTTGTAPATSQSNPPSPRAGEIQKPPQDERSTPQQPADTQQHGTEDRPVVVEVLPTKKTADERAQDAEDRRNKSSADWWLIKLTGALVFVGILQFLALIGQAIVYLIQARVMRDSVDASARAYISTHRPRIKVRWVSFVDFLPLEEQIAPPQVQLRFGNVGETDAFINERKTIVTVRRMSAFNIEMSLARVPGFRQEKGDRMPSGHDWGESPLTEWQVAGDPTFKLDRTKHQIYCIGWVSYTDANGTERRTGWCRRYDWAAQRFVVDHDSEHEYCD